MAGQHGAAFALHCVSSFPGQSPYKLVVSSFCGEIRSFQHTLPFTQAHSYTFIQTHTQTHTHTHTHAHAHTQVGMITSYFAIEAVMLAFLVTCVAVGLLSLIACSVSVFIEEKRLLRCLFSSLTYTVPSFTLFPLLHCSFYPSTLLPFYNVPSFKLFLLLHLNHLLLQSKVDITNWGTYLLIPTVVSTSAGIWKWKWMPSFVVWIWIDRWPPFCRQVLIVLILIGIFWINRIVYLVIAGKGLATLYM